MEPPVPPSDETKKVGETIEGLSKAVAVCIATLYVCGFLITSLHDFSYGFSETNPLRPRILTAGAWFLLSLAVPFALVRELLRQKLWVAEEKWWFKAVSLLFTYWVSCMFIFWTAGTVFAFDEHNIAVAPLPATWKIVLGLFVSVLALVAIVTFFSKIPKSVLAIGFCVIFGNLLWKAIENLFWNHQFDASALTLWMVAIGAVCMYEMRVRSWEFKLGDWPRSLIALLTALLVFATAYYPHIKSSWGGGMPIPVSLTLTKDSAALAGRQVNCLLIDETDSGFYVAGKNDQHATFVPRGSVGLIHFADSSEVSLFTPQAK